MTDEKEVEIFFSDVFRNLWLECDISLEACSVTASTQTILTKYKKPILETMLMFLHWHKSKSSKIVKDYFEAELSAKGYDQFPEIAVRFLDDYLENLKSFNIFLKIVNSCSIMCVIGAHLHHEGFLDVLQMTVSVYSKYFIAKLKDNFYKSDAWNKIGTDIETNDFLNIFDEELEVSETKKSVHQVQCEEGAVSKPLSSLDEIKDKRKNNENFPCKPSTSTISDSSDFSDLSDYEIIGWEVFPIKKNSKYCSDKKQISKRIIKESFSQQDEESAGKEIIGRNGRKNPKCSALQSQQNSFPAHISPSFIPSDTVNQRNVQCPYRQNINNQRNITHVQGTCNASNIKTHILHSKDVTGGRQTEDHKLSSSQTEKIFSNSKNGAEAGIDKSSSVKENESQLAISALCHQVTETHRGGTIKDHIFSQNSFRNLNETVGKIESKMNTLVLKSDSAKGTNFSRALLESKAVETNSHKTAKPSTESHAKHCVEGSLNIRSDNSSDIVKNNSNNCNKNEMQSSAASSTNQVNEVSVKYKEEKKEYFDHTKENDLKLCWKDKSSKRDKTKKKRRNFKK